MNCRSPMLPVSGKRQKSEAHQCITGGCLKILRSILLQVGHEARRLRTLHSRHEAMSEGRAYAEMKGGRRIARAGRAGCENESRPLSGHLPILPMGAGNRRIWRSIDWSMCIYCRDRARANSGAAAPIFLAGALNLRLHPLTSQETGAGFTLSNALQYGSLPKISMLLEEGNLEPAREC